MVEASLAAVVPRPLRQESPAEYASRIGVAYSMSAPIDRRRKYGQFFTPTEIGRFMAKMLVPLSDSPTVLDPCVGTGVLACAVVEAIVDTVESMHLEVFEVDGELAPMAEASLSYAAEWVAQRGKRLTFSLNRTDFFESLRDAASTPLFSDGNASYELAIANPPYFKLPASSALPFPNIYAAFMSEMARRLVPGGTMVTITPRSFATGTYFGAFRRSFFGMVTPRKLHVFDSRAAAFRKDDVLQENIILCATKGRPDSSFVDVTVSLGVSDLDRARARCVPGVGVIDLAQHDPVLRVPGDEVDDRVLEFVGELPETLGSLGLAVSTGPVVAFRASKHLRLQPEPATVPLLWLSNIRYMTVEWSAERKSAKPKYVVDDDSSRRLLTASGNYVLIRRFSAKEEYRRITAAPLFKGQLPGNRIGIENHLNYIYRPGGQLSAEQVVGLSAVLGSQLINRYFRIHNGHTQVNATELRAIPLPSMSSIERLGATLLEKPVSETQLEPIIMRDLGVPEVTASGVWALRHD
jgi:adenine-specific DNA-methyltransferase